MIKMLENFFCNKKILLLGFGMEGRSTLRLLEKFRERYSGGTSSAEYMFSVTVADRNAVDTNYPSICGEDYLRALEGDFDIIMKSPGIALFDKVTDEVRAKITGQSDLFLRFSRECQPRKGKVVGITGTKGKSTTSALLHHILLQYGTKSKLIGNIGVPAFDVADELNPDDTVVFELSCHQLEYVKASPEIAVLLNVYEEHLDHYAGFERYKYAKENIFRYQMPGDTLILGENVCENPLLIPEKAKLRGKHNLKNMAVAVKVAALLGVPEEKAVEAAYSFTGLEHRLELFAEIGGVNWVNDSISTIPAATIAAAEAFPETDTLIIGGMDRGIDYSSLVGFLRSRTQISVITLPDSGHIIAEKLTAAKAGNKVYKARDLTDAVNHAKESVKDCCVFSPAAASYGFYKNFEERGKCFKELVLGK
jgi:UDP-N-acetylmuramoylalanine--D-glutamate ligase